MFFFSRSMPSWFSQIPLVRLLQVTWHATQGRHRALMAAMILLTFANVVLFFEPLIVAKLFNTLQLEGLNAQTIVLLFWCLGGLLLIPLIQWIFHGPARVIELETALFAKHTYKQHLFDGVLRFPLEWHAEHHSGETIDKIEKGANSLYNFSSNLFLVVEFVVRIVTSIAGLIYFNVHAGYIVLGVMLVTFLSVMKFDRILAKRYDQIFKIDNAISSKVFDVVSNITTVVVLRIEQLLSKDLAKKLREPFGVFRKTMILSETKWFFVSMMSALMLVLVVGSSLVSSYLAGGVILVGTLYALYGYLSRITDLLFRFAWVYADIVHQDVAVQASEQLSRAFAPQKSLPPPCLHRPWKTLEVRDLSFTYPVGAAEMEHSVHLRQICLTVERGARVALIGQSGSGKTTLLKIIRELYRPQKGGVWLDGKRLKGGFADLSPEIALIPQEPEIFATSIRDNLTLGVSRSNAFIKRFTDMACVTDVIDGLPHKLDSLMNEKGVNLSGGQKQRIALARGLMACEDKALLLLDEPTSSVDAQNERQIFQNIFTSFSNQTILATVHRLHLLPLFDRVIWFERGAIIAEGTFPELLASNDRFQALWNTYHMTHHTSESLAS